MAEVAQLPEHSPLGGSGAYRWMPCPGSVGLSSGIQDSESDYAAEGTAAHELAAYCLENDLDAFRSIGVYHAGKDIVVDKEMADAVQVYLDAVRSRYSHGPKSWNVESAFYCPDLHHYYYGRVDFAAPSAPGELDIWDYKHGAGIVVEVPRNPQLMYYAAGWLQKLGMWSYVEQVNLYVAQPRVTWHPQGVIRRWSIGTQELHQWLHDELLPAMRRAETDDHVESGEHCRFCPARLRACPALLRDADELEELVKMIKENTAKELTNDQIVRAMKLEKTVGIHMKAAKEVGFQRSQLDPIPGTKLVHGQKHRGWKDGAEEKLVAALGDDAYQPKTLKTPAQVDGIPGGEKLTAEHAFKPQGPLQLVLDTDSRREAGPKVKSMFAPVKKKRGKK